MPHIHGVAWINQDWLKNFGIKGYLTESPKKAVELADMLVTCQTTNEPLKKTAKEVQTHKHTKSCMKYNGICRYGFEKLPSRRTLMTEPLPDDIDQQQKKDLMESANKILS